MMQDIFVFGGGAWGLALAHAFSQKIVFLYYQGES